MEKNAEHYYPEAEKDEYERLESLAARLGFTEIRILHRDNHTSPLIHARWRGAPVALSLRTGLAGGFSCAFYRGVQVDENGETARGEEWDEVADTHFGDPEMALIIGAALLEEFSDGREMLYQDAPHASGAQFKKELTDDEVLDEALQGAKEK